MTYPDEIREIINDYLVEDHRPKINECHKDIQTAFLFLRMSCRSTYRCRSINHQPQIKVYSISPNNKGIMCTICQEKVALSGRKRLRVRQFSFHLTPRRMLTERSSVPTGWSPCE